MGSTNHGSQTITFGYYTNANQDTWAELNNKVVPTGIYSGGYLTRVSDSEITLSAMVAVLEDATHNVRVKTSSAASITTATLDSGVLSSAHPWIVLRWVYLASVGNYMEVHALSSLSSLLTNDIVVGKVNWAGLVITGFDYADRNDPITQKYTLKVEATEETELYVRLRRGRVISGSAYYNVANQKVGPFVAPTTNSRIDLVYLNTATGVPAILQGVEAASPVAPNHGGKMVLAQVTLAPGVSNITDAVITDTRSDVSVPARVDDDSLQYNASGQLEIKNPFGSAVVYDSGWFEAVTQTEYLKEHNLGSTNVLAQLYFAPDDGGSPDLTQMTLMGCNIDINNDRFHYATSAFSKLTETTVTVYGGYNRVGAYPDLTGPLQARTYASGWLKVVLLKLV